MGGRLQLYGGDDAVMVKVDFVRHAAWFDQTEKEGASDEVGGKAVVPVIFVGSRINRGNFRFERLPSVNKNFVFVL